MYIRILHKLKKNLIRTKTYAIDPIPIFYLQNMYDNNFDLINNLGNDFKFQI
jgi:hypothetical protein